MHLGFAAQPLDIRLKMTLIGTYGATKGVVILEAGSETERQHGGMLKALRNDAGMIFGGLLIHTGDVFRSVLGDHDSKVGRGK